MPCNQRIFGPLLNRNIPASRDEARFPIRISTCARCSSSVYSGHEAISQTLWSHGASPPPWSERLNLFLPGPKPPLCLPKVLRCLPSARALIVIYNHDPAPWRGANTRGLMKVADGFPSLVEEYHVPPCLDDLCRFSYSVWFCLTKVPVGWFRLSPTV